MTIPLTAPRMPQIEFDWALEQALAGGLLKSNESGGVTLSDAGVDHCVALEQQLHPIDRLLLLLFYLIITGGIEDE